MKRPDVFISYRRDRGSHLATAVRSELEREGLDVALDVDILQGGRQWLPQLKESISRSHHFVLLLTIGSLARMNEPDDVSALEVEIAYATRCHIVVLLEDKAAGPNGDTVLPHAIRSLPAEHMLPYDHRLARESMRRLLEALEIDSKSKQREATSAFARIDAAVRDPAFQDWQTERMWALYAPAAEAAGLTGEGLFFPSVRGRRYPVTCFASALADEPFSHELLGPPRLDARIARDLPKLVVDPDAEIPHWVAGEPLTRRYFELLSYAQRVRRWNMRGFALKSLHLDASGRVTGFDARICTYGENCLTSHVLGFDLLESWQHDTPLVLDRPPLSAILRIDGDAFLPLISVQAIVAYRDDEGAWRVIRMERAANLAAASGFSQFPPAGGFEIFGNETDDEDHVRDQFDIRMALMREFLEEIFGDAEMACEAPAGSDQEGAEGYRRLLRALRDGKAAIHFLGVVTEMISFRPEFSFLIVLTDLEFFRDLRYTHTLPSGEVAKAQWLTARTETRRLRKDRLDPIDTLLARDRKWHSSSMGMLVLLARASNEINGWLQCRYPDFPRLALT